MPCTQSLCSTFQAEELKIITHLLYKAFRGGRWYSFHCSLNMMLENCVHTWHFQTARACVGRGETNYINRYTNASVKQNATKAGGVLKGYQKCGYFYLVNRMRLWYIVIIYSYGITSMFLYRGKKLQDNHENCNQVFFICKVFEVMCKVQLPVILLRLPV